MTAASHSPNGLVVVRVRDHINPALAGHDGCQYNSPPQSADQARSLVALLLGCTTDALDGQDSWTQPIAGGRRTVTVTPARPGARAAQSRPTSTEGTDAHAQP
jgi:hypothetical protein